jgi:hypothetical protein
VGVWIDAAGVSRHHARILVTGAPTIEDLGSKSGTYLHRRGAGCGVFVGFSRRHLSDATRASAANQGRSAATGRRAVAPSVRRVMRCGARVTSSTSPAN